MKNVELYYNDDRSAYAVLISPGYGSGWFTDNCSYPEIAYDREIIAWYSSLSPEYIDEVKIRGTDANKYASSLFTSLGYNDIYFGGLKENMIRWIPIGSIWRIREYDGAEYIEYLDLKEWNQF